MGIKYLLDTHAELIDPAFRDAGWGVGGELSSAFHGRSRLTKIYVLLIGNWNEF